MAKKAKWKMPAWMEKYRGLLSTGDFTAEELIDRLWNEKNLMQSNILVYTMAAIVEGQITLLTRFHQDRLLA